MKTKKHKLKIREHYLRNLIHGRKKVEIRFNDRDYQVGDALEFEDVNGVYYFFITHVHSGLGMETGYLALSVEPEEGNYIDVYEGKLK